ncbi:MAG TPA: hypothetical protein VFA09_14940 [Ktedonobacteraceae bacterium]|nr:hypothetical protein [Ktedonobacteraceae bacterium]
MISGQNLSGLKVDNGFIVQDGDSLSEALNEIINELKMRHKLLENLGQSNQIDLDLLLLQGTGDANTALGAVGEQRLNELIGEKQDMAQVAELVKNLLGQGNPHIWLQIYPQVGWPMARLESALYHEIFLHVRPMVNALTQIRTGAINSQNVTQVLASQVLFGEAAQHADLDAWIYALQAAANRAAFLRNNGREQDAMMLMVYMGQDFLAHLGSFPENLRTQAKQACNGVFQKAGFGEIAPFQV